MADKIGPSDIVDFGVMYKLHVDTSLLAHSGKAMAHQSAKRKRVEVSVN